MPSVYTSVRDLRGNLKEALDTACTQPVFIKRGDQTFMLQATTVKPNIVEAVIDENNAVIDAKYDERVHALLYDTDADWGA